MTALLPLGCHICSSFQCNWFQKTFFTHVLVSFYLVVTTVNSVTGEIICWMPIIDCGYSSLFFSIFIITLWYCFWFFFTVIKISLDCVLTEDKELKAAEAFYHFWRLHTGEYEASGLQFSSFLASLPGTASERPHCIPLGTHCTSYHLNFAWKANLNTQTILGAPQLQTACSGGQRPLSLLPQVSCFSLWCSRVYSPVLPVLILKSRALKHQPI